MPFSFSTALSGLRANSDSLGVTGNNIANSNTTAFKSSTISFADVFTSSIGVRLNGAGESVQIGGGVRTAATPTNYAQGSIKETGTSTNAAIQGNGFFVVADASGARSYTRAGDFSLDREGYLTTPNGQKVQGFAAVNGDIPPGAALTSIKVPIGETMAPAVTTKASFRMNLNSADPAGTEFHAPAQVYDSKGDAHTLDLTFKKQKDGSYDVTATLDGADVTSPAKTNVTFDADGQLKSPDSIDIVPDQTKLNGAALPSITINLRETNTDGTPGAANLTNYAAASAVAATKQDGFAAGTLTGLSFSSEHDGKLLAVFSNGQARPIGQLAVATFNSQDGLRHLGNNAFGETLASGQPSIGMGGTGGRGDVIGSSLEGSNVDLATEFTELIVAQRGFQANSRVISTISQTMQDLLQIS